MYIRTPRALVWVEQPKETPQLPASAKAAFSSLYKERWANTPLNTTRARCVAVRQHGEKIELGCMINNRLIWIADTHQILSETKLKIWLRDGFLKQWK